MSSDNNFCPFCGSDEIKFNGFIITEIKPFNRRVNFHRCRKCKKKVSNVI